MMIVQDLNRKLSQRSVAKPQIHLGNDGRDPCGDLLRGGIVGSTSASLISFFRAVLMAIAPGLASHLYRISPL